MLYQLSHVRSAYETVSDPGHGFKRVPPQAQVAGCLYGPGRMRPSAAPWSSDFVGRFEHATVESAALRDNPLGDPRERPLWVYLPPGYDDGPDGRLPGVYVIQGYTGHVAMWGNRDAVPAAVPRDRRRGVRRRRRAAGCVVVFVDAWTAYGGSAVRRLARAPAATTRTSATRSCRGWTRATAPSPPASRARSAASPAAGSAR